MTPEQKKGIRNWLTKGRFWRGASCPFESTSTTHDSKICLEWFPNIKGKGFLYGSNMCAAHHRCPCDIYNKDYVARKARRLLK